MKRPPHKGGLQQPLENQKGFALLISLLIIILLVVMIFEADFQSRADLRAAGNFRDDLKAFYLARSAVSAAEALLKDDAKNSSAYDGLDEFWAFPMSEFPLGDGVLSGVIEDEERKINLNSLTKRLTTTTVVNQPMKAQLERLFELLALDPHLVDAIVDWIDPDGDPQPFGAEDETYLRLDPPYETPDRPFETLEELRMVSGITDEIYRKIEPYVTIYGTGGINVNTADLLVIQSLHETIDETDADNLAEKRPFKSVGGSEGARRHFQIELGEAYNNAISGPIGLITTKSKYFSLKAEGRVNGTRKRIRAVIRRAGQLTKLLYFRID